VPVFAAIYESPIHIDDEDDLRAMGDRDELSDATVETLLELLQDGIDLNVANREELYELPSLTYADVDAIIAYRKNQPIGDPAALVAAGAITADQLEQMAPFIIVADATGKIPVGGYYHLLGNYTVGDPMAPPFYLQGTVRGPFSLTGGIGLTTTRRQVGSPFFDPLRTTRDNGAGDFGTLSVTPAKYNLEVPKFYLQWRGTKFRVIAGTFRVGFGERLTLDNTTRTNPNGITPDDAFFIYRDLVSSCTVSAGELPQGTDVCPNTRYVTPDMKWRTPFRGVALAAEDLELGETARASLYAFGSFQTHNIYQYELTSHRSCPDPRDDANPDCAAPNVYLRQGDGTDSELKTKYTTLPNLWDELAVGGHAALTPTPGLSFGLTGYFAKPFWHVPEANLDFQEWSKYPFGGPWGAVGLNARLTVGTVNFFIEGARSFDQEPNGGGGWGVVQRTVIDGPRRELETDLRLYDIRFVNPYARPVSSPDEVDGQRARDEAGILLKYTDRSLGDFQLTSLADFWVLPWDSKGLEYDISGYGFAYGFKAGTMNARALVRGDYTGWSIFQPSLWFEWRDKDIGDQNALPASMGLKCYSLTTGLPPGGKTCVGERYRFGVEFLIRAIPRKLELTLTYIHDLISNPHYAHIGMDLRFTAELRSQPVDWLLIRLRSKYLNDDLFSTLQDNATIICVNPDGEPISCQEKSLWTFLEVTYVGLRAFHVGARYDVFLWLDQRASTMARVPNPEHRLRLELEGRF
jgi:hypothetical protein